MLRMIVAIAVIPFNFTFGFITYHACSWAVYEIIGADSTSNHIFMSYQAFMTFLRADFFFGFLFLFLGGYTGYLAKIPIYYSSLFLL